LGWEVVKSAFGKEFKIFETAQDSAMSRFIPMVYDPIGFDWKTFFEQDFVDRFNGLMISGGTNVKKVYCVVFFNDEIVNEILNKNEDGVMIFAHHPVQMECGDPKGKKGRGFLPIDPELLRQIKARGISVYTCHAPLDAGSVSGLGTGEAIVKRLNAKVLSQYDEYAHGYAGRVFELPEVTTTEALAEKLRIMCDLPYVDIQGIRGKQIKKVAILPGGGGSVDDIKLAEEQGVDCIITGEVTCKIDNERGEREKKALEEYYPTTSILAIGLSHAGSEFLVMYDVVDWIKKTLGIEAEVLAEKRWRR